MINEEILRMILLGSGTVLVLVVIYAVFELIRTLRWVRYTAEDLQPSIKQATEVLEALEPTVKKATDILETLGPTMKRIDPLMERVSLTVDAVNLEIMRADQILANLTDVTDVASSAAKKVNVITDAPLNLLTSATDKVRNIFSDRKPRQDTQAALVEAEADQPVTTVTPPTVAAGDTQTTAAPPTVAAGDTQATTADHIAAAADPIAVVGEERAASTDDDNGTPPYQDDIDVVEPEANRPKWPF